MVKVFFSPILLKRFVFAEYMNKSRKMPECLIKVTVYMKKFQFQSGKSSRSKVVQVDQPLDNQDNKPDISIETENEAKERAAKEEENKKKIEKSEFDSNLGFLNSLAFFLLLLIIFCCDMVFWILAGS